MKTLANYPILIPNKGIDMTKWSVVSCDQYTPEPDYWSKLESIVKDAPSALRLIYPEVYLSEAEPEKRIAKINKTMQEYLDGGVFREIKESYILIKKRLKKLTTVIANTRLNSSPTV